MSFNFQPVLSTLFPQAEFAIEPLDGGLVNTTVRARRISGDSQSVPASLILKHAAPFVAAAGPELPFSIERQNVEATVLKLFHDDGPLADLPTRCAVTIPKLIYYDKEASILVLEDVGALGTLWEILTTKSCADVPFTQIEQTCQEIGQRIGVFFAHLHSQATLDKLKENRDTMEVLTHTLTDGLVFDAAVKPVHERLEKYGIKNAQILADRVAKDYQSPKYAYAPIFSIGDFHPGSILVPDWSILAAQFDSPPPPALIDWEFASVRGRGVNGDIAQILASIHCYIVTLKTRVAASVGTAAFVRGLSAGYGQHAAHAFEKSPDNMALRLLRSYLIVHGREMVNLAFERDWGSSADEVVLAKMVEVGAFYIASAGDSVEELVEDGNWKALLVNDHGVVETIFKIASAQSRPY